MTFAEYCAWLFKIGTGWLGWAPAAVLASTMPELLLAHEGKIDMLKAIHGSAEKPGPALTPVRDGAGIRALMKGLGAKRATA